MSRYTVTLTEEQWEAWLAALESGRYVQGRGRLRRREAGGPPVYQYCCMGVLCDTLGVDWEGQADVGLVRLHGSMSGIASAPDVLSAALPVNLREMLANQNDDPTGEFGTFGEIAAELRRRRRAGEIVLVEP